MKYIHLFHIISIVIMSFLCSIAYEKISAQNDIEIPPPQDIVNFLNQLDTDPPSEEKQKLGNSFTSRANSLSDQGRYEEALNTYMKALVADPTNYEAINSIGIILGEFERYEEAVKAYDKAIEVLKSQNPQDHDLVIMATNKAIDLTELGDYDNAMLSIDAALSINPNHADAYLYQGDILDRQGKYEEALEAYDKAIALDPNIADIYLYKGITLQNLNKLEESLQVNDKAIALDPNYSLAYYNKGVYLTELNKPEEALEAYDKAIALDPNYVDALVNKGSLLNDLSRYEEALQVNDKAISLDPNDSLAYYNKGVILSNLDKHEEALEAYDKAIALDPNYVDAYNDKGESLSALGKYDEAELEYNKAISLSSSNTTNNMINEIKPNDIQPIVNTNVPVESLITQLKELTTLKQNNIITEEEFQHLKSMLIK